MTIWILTALMPLIMLVVWNTVAADGPIARYGQPEFARYFASALVVRQLTAVWVIWMLNFEIRTGALSARLLRPVNPLYVDAVWMLSALPFRIVILLPILGAVVLWKPALLWVPDALTLMVFTFSVLMAFILSFLVQAWFGVLSFWFDQSAGLFGVWYSAWMVLSGYIAPLELFGEGAQVWLRFLPFRSMVAVPVELLGGFLTPAEALPDLAIQLAWVVVFGVLLTFTWRRGLVRYGAYGA